MVVAEWTDLEGMATANQVQRFDRFELGGQVTRSGSLFPEKLGARIEQGRVSGVVNVGP